MTVLLTEKNDPSKEKIHSDVENINYCSEDRLITISTLSGQSFRYNLSVWNMSASAK